VLTAWDSTQGLEIGKGIIEEEDKDDGNDSDCAVGMQSDQACRLYNIQKC